MTTPLADNLPAAVSGLFRKRWDRCYARAKLRTDPLYDGVFSCLKDSSLPLLDVGCGLGLLAFSLRHRGFQPAITGLDFDRRKIEEARRIADTQDMADLGFHHHDARRGLPAHAGNVTILDILQFFEPAEMRALLHHAVQRVAPGGLLVIRSAVRDKSCRYRLTVAGDLLARATLWMKSAPVHYPDRADFEQALAPHGALTVTPLWGRTPFNNYLVVLRRETPASG